MAENFLKLRERKTIDRFKSTITLLFAVISFLVFPFSLLAKEGKGGQGGGFLRLGVGARAVAMGCAFTAIADDAFATYWNPAGLDQLKKPQLAAMYSLLSLDRSHNFVSYVHPLGSLGSFGISWINFGVSKIEKRDKQGNLIGHFSNSEAALVLSYGKRLAKIFYIGGNAKYFLHSLADKKASGFGFDVGALFNLYNVVSIGAVAQDIRSSITWNTPSKHKDKFPTQIRFGTAINPKLLPLKLAAEIEKTSNQNITYHAGVEYRLLKILALRAGYNNKNLTAGSSFQIPAGILKLAADYAFTTDNIDDKTAHKFSVLIKF